MSPELLLNVNQRGGTGAACALAVGSCAHPPSSHLIQRWKPLDAAAVGSLTHLLWVN